MHLTVRFTLIFDSFMPVSDWWSSMTNLVEKDMFIADLGI